MSKRKKNSNTKKTTAPKTPAEILAHLREHVAAFPKAPGVYIMCDGEGREIYVGKAARLRERVRSYFQSVDKLTGKNRLLVENIHDVKYIQTVSEVEALVLEARMIKDLQPKYNVRLKNNDAYPLVEMPWGDDFPRPRVTREKAKKGAKYYGPFVDVTGLREALKILRRVFPYRTCKRVIKEGDSKLRHTRPCLNYHIKLCAAPCAGKISRRDYRGMLARLGNFLRGQKVDVTNELEALMNIASKKRDYELAARYRDEIKAIQSLDRRGKLGEGAEPAPPTIDPRSAIGAMGKYFGVDTNIRTIEGIDIAHLGGTDAVGSVVRFEDGFPSKNGYRRFKIQQQRRSDDYASITEVVTRRYGRLLREDKPLPDIILIDGGTGQLNVAAKALVALGLTRIQLKTAPILAAISKSPETPGRRKIGGTSKVGSRRADVIRTLAQKSGVVFPRGNASFRLLQFVRDEAHRFAQHYHHIRRKKSMLEG